MLSMRSKRLWLVIGVILLMGVFPFLEVAGRQPALSPTPADQTISADRSASGGASSSTILPVGPNFKLTGTTPSQAGNPGVAFDGANFIVPYQQGAGIYALRVAPQGAVLDSTPITISVGLNESSTAPSVVFDGTNHLVLWVARRAGVWEVYGARVTPAGNVLDPGGVQITNGSDASWAGAPGLAMGDTNALVVWKSSGSHDGDVKAARVSPSLVNLDAPAGVKVAEIMAWMSPAVAFGGTNYLVVWNSALDYGETEQYIYGARLTQQGAVLDPDGFVISDELQHQDQSRVAFDGMNYLVVWYGWAQPDNQYLPGSILGARVSPAGAVLDAPAFQIARRVSGFGATDLVCELGDCLVIWSSDSGEGIDLRSTDVWGRRISQSGEILDLQGIPVATAFGKQGMPLVGYGNGQYLVVWSEGVWRDEGFYAQVLQRQAAPGLQFKHRAAEATVPRLRQSAWVTETIPISSWGWATAGLAFSARNFYVFGNHQVLHYQNGAWQTEDVGNGTFASWANAPDDIWITGGCRGFLHFDGQSWSAGCYFGGIGTAIWGSSPTDLWATGATDAHATDDNRGNLIRYDGYSNWKAQDSGVPFDLADLWGTSASNIYAIGERGIMLRYNGDTWDQQAGIPTIQRLNALWGSGANDIYAVGDWGVILHFDGAAWSVMDSGTLAHLFDVWGVSGSEIYAVGFEGTILRYDGLAWKPENSATTMDLLSVWGVESECKQTVWASGSGQQILKHETPTGCSLAFTVIGHGTVSRVPDQPVYNYGDVITLTATADPGWSFAGWSGAVVTATNPVTLTIMDNTVVTATFTQDEYTLSVDITGSGAVTRQPNEPTYHYGDEVTLTATADPGWSFSGWSGTVITATNPVTLTIMDNTVVTATFTQDEYTLSVDITGSGAVTRDPNQPTYHYGDEITLTAIADPNWGFTGWGGDIVSSQNPLVVVIQGNLQLTARFVTYRIYLPRVIKH